MNRRKFTGLLSIGALSASATRSFADNTAKNPINIPDMEMGSNDAPVLQMQLPKILSKVNSIYGYNAISKIKITQTSPIDFENNFENLEDRENKKVLSEKQIINVETSVKNVSDINLKDALSRLGKNIIIRNNKD